MSKYKQILLLQLSLLGFAFISCIGAFDLSLTTFFVFFVFYELLMGIPLIISIIECKENKD